MTTTGLIRGNIRQQWQLLPLTSVIVMERQRKVNPTHVKNIRASFESLGGQLQLQPIVVNEKMILIDGAHRLAAAVEEGWTHISAIILEGVTEADRPLLEAEANRVRLQLTPLELEEAWTTIYEPAFKARARSNQSEGAKNRSAGNIITVDSSNGREQWVKEPVSLPKAAKESTGLSLDTINKISDIRSIAGSDALPEEVRTAAQRGLEKLRRPGAPVDTVHKALIKMQDRVSRKTEDPTETQRRLLEKRLDQTLTDTTLLAEKLGGQLGEDLLAAAKQEHVAKESLRAIRVALTNSLASIASTECLLEQDHAAALRRVGAEVTRMLSEQSIKLLDLEAEQ